MAFLKYVSGFFLILIIGVSVFVYREYKDKKIYVTQIRKDFQSHLVKMPEVDYVNLVGGKPSSERVELGRMLFNDPILSRNNNVSCATCHLTNHGFADGNFLSVGSNGVGGPSGNNVGPSWGEGVLSLKRELSEDSQGFRNRHRMFRNTLSTVNVAFRTQVDNSDGLFNDGRFGSIFFQALMPIHTDLELCGSNPVSIENNVFAPGGPLFDSPVKISHVNTFDPFRGVELGDFNGVPTEIPGIPSLRPHGNLSVPGRNECVAIAVAKIRKVPEYVNAFKLVFGDDEITDQRIAIAVATFMLTHVSKDTAYDRFVAGNDSSLSEKQLKGMISFFTPIGEKYKLKGQDISGAGCFKCHDAPLFGGQGFVSLGVRSDEESTLAVASNVFHPSSSFFGRNRLQRGFTANCHLEGVTTSTTDAYAPDIGRANGTFKDEDCFKFRVPPLRNVAETYPYFHHGSARAQGHTESDFKKRSILALKQVVKYHLRGPVEVSSNRSNVGNLAFFDDLHLFDPFVPVVVQNFIALDINDKQMEHATDLFPVQISEEDVDNLVDFVGFGLLDKNTTKIGDLGNDVSHPKTVLSGYSPSITRDNGNQNELPPNMKR